MEVDNCDGEEEGGEDEEMNEGESAGQVQQKRGLSDEAMFVRGYRDMYFMLVNLSTNEPVCVRVWICCFACCAFAVRVRVCRRHMLLRIHPLAPCFPAATGHFSSPLSLLLFSLLQICPTPLLFSAAASPCGVRRRAPEP